MQKALFLIPIARFMFGGFIVNLQMWYSARSDSLAGAQYAIKNIDVILDEARLASHTAMSIAEKGCDLEQQYRLGTEAALQPYLRTIMIFKQGSVYCSSLPGNRILLINVDKLPDSPLMLAPAKSTVNGLPVLIYQTHFANSRIVITVSDRHLRDALNVPLKDVNYALKVGNTVIGMSGDVTTTSEIHRHSGRVEASVYPYSIEYTLPPLFSLHKLIARAWGVLLFLLLISSLAAYILNKYLNKNNLPEEALRWAIVKGEIVPFYQPIVNGKDGSLRGVEVLARWKHPHGGYMPPASFIPLAEKAGLIVPLTQSLMAQVVTNINTIASKIPKGFHVGINFSASHIALPTFVEDCLKYKDSFSRHDLNLVIEVTEREPLVINERLVQKLNALHDNGFAIALDDFGTGYSGLSYLHDLHIDYIKVDKSFVGRVNEYEDSTVILDSVLDLACKLSISIVAEGVETQEQLDYLNRKNINLLQGYYFYKPVPFNKLIVILLSKPNAKIVLE